MLMLNIVYSVILFFSAYYIVFHLNLWFDYRNDIDREGGSKIMPFVSMIIPAYNEGDIIGKTLKKIKNLDYPKSKLEVIFVDDGSTDGTLEKAKEVAKKIELRNIRFFEKENKGKAAALNFGIDVAKNEFVAVVDADSFLHKNALRACMRYFDREKVAAVTSHILSTKKKNFWERMQNIELMVISVTRKLEEFVNVIWVTPGPLSVYRKDVLEEIGGFDENNLVEDVEIAWRILDNGYEIRMAIDSLVTSLYPSSFRRWWRQRVRWSIGGLQTFSKYKSSLRGSRNAVGRFLIPTSFFGYSSSIVGIGIFMYFISIRLVDFFLYTTRAYSLGINPFARWDFSYYIDFKVIFGLIVFFLSLSLLKIGIDRHRSKVKWYDIVLFLFVYPILYLLINLEGIYRYYVGRTGWMTK